jgi:hypothetical protein
VPLYTAIEKYLSEVTPEGALIPVERRQALDRLAGFIAERAASARSSRLTFICTHNSRRSQMSQIWAEAAAARFGVSGVETYSGGTEATAFNPRAVAAMGRAGFRIDDGRRATRSTGCAGRWREPMESSPSSTTAPTRVRLLRHHDLLGADAACRSCRRRERSPALRRSGAVDGGDQETAAYDKAAGRSRARCWLFSRVRSEPTAAGSSRPPLVPTTGWPR